MAKRSKNGAEPQGPTQATPASEFRRVREQGELITIPATGRVVRMRTVKPSHLLRLGTIPDPLAEMAMQVLYGKITEEEYANFFALAERVEHALDMIESLRVVCTAALVEPRVAEGEPEADDEIHIDDLEDGEQRWIFDLALLEASGLRRFRERQEADVEAEPESAAGEPQPEPDAGN